MKPLGVETRDTVRRTAWIGGGTLLLLAGVFLVWRLTHHPAAQPRAAEPAPPISEPTPTPTASLPLPAPPRPPEVPAPPTVAAVGHPVDLTTSYNAEMADGVSMGTKEHPNNLSEFPTGEQVLAGVLFSVQGLIQFGSIYPKRVEGIRVGTRCQRLHLLHGTAGTAPDGAPCASLTLHYADGSTAELNLNYGEHLRDWWNWKKNEPTTLDPGTEIAWWGDNDYARSRKCRLRVYRSTFANPNPDQVLETIDYTKQRSGCNPFLLGLSTE